MIHPSMRINLGLLGHLVTIRTDGRYNGKQLPPKGAKKQERLPLAEYARQWDVLTKANRGLEPMIETAIRLKVQPGRLQYLQKLARTGKFKDVAVQEVAA